MSPATITAWTSLVTAFAAAIWPIIAIVALLFFRGAVLDALRRVGSDGGTIEFFGVKLNVGKATEQQQKLIEDLQRQVALLRDASRIRDEIGGGGTAEPLGFNTALGRHAPRVETGSSDWAPRGATTAVGSPPASAAAVPGAAPAPPPSRGSRAPHLLWVDDHPENNSVLAASLRRRGIVIVDAIDTATALDTFRPGAFDAVISDMGRDTADAGVRLTEQLRERDRDVPILIFCTIGAKRNYGNFAKQAGATFVTESATLLMEKLEQLALLDWPVMS